jgi:hypothetical protein
VALTRGTVLGGYRIEGEIGAGRPGMVYRATQLALGRPVALRVLSRELSGDESFRKRFRREAMLQAALEHPNVVPVYEAGEADDRAFLATRLVNGKSLKELLDDGALSPERALRILGQIASGLDAAHQAGLIHRGLRPQSILVDETGHAYLGDFGLTKAAGEYGLTEASPQPSSLEYVSPEQIRHEPPTAGSDLYALAALLYESLSGEAPFVRDTEAAMLYAHLSEPPPRLTERRPELPAALDRVIAKGLAKKPEERYASAGELIADAKEALEGPAPAPRRTPRAVLVGVAALVPVLAALGFLLGHRRDSEQPVAAAIGAGPVSLAFPSDWRSLAGADGLPGLRLADPIVLTWGSASARGELWAGIAPDAEGPLMLPADFARALSSRPRPQAVRLGSLEALRFRDLRHPALSTPLTLFVVPTDRGAATIACLGREALDPCEGIAATVSLRKGTALALGPSTSYGSALRVALAELNRARARGRAQLASATTQRAQSRNAQSLSAIFGDAARAVGRAHPGPAERPSHRALRGALMSIGEGYGALAAAARRDDRAAFERAAGRVRNAEDALDRALTSLERLGYAVTSSG